MRHLKTMLLGAALMVGTTTFAVAQSVVPVQWGWGQGATTMTGKRSRKATTRASLTRGIIGALIRTTTAGESATTARLTAQDTSAASAKAAANNSGNGRDRDWDR